jgi:hypothetical protein
VKTGRVEAPVAGYNFANDAGNGHNAAYYPGFVKARSLFSRYEHIEDRAQTTQERDFTQYHRRRFIFDA